MKLGIVNLGISNLGSLLEAFRRIGCDWELIAKPEELHAGLPMVLPGVGAFRDGMSALNRSGLADALRKHADQGGSLFGICLGMQLLFEKSEEQGQHDGLGILKGRVRKLEIKRPGERVPNMGWCDVSSTRPAAQNQRLRLDETKSFYFLHSYWCDCANPEDIAATIDFGIPVTAAVERGHVAGVQFHPEKSQDAGIDLLDAWCKAATVISDS